MIRSVLLRVLVPGATVAAVLLACACGLALATGGAHAPVVVAAAAGVSVATALALLRARVESFAANALCALGLVAGATVWGGVRAPVAGTVAFVGAAIFFVLAVLVVCVRATGGGTSAGSATH
jgi:hypothetical protein